MGVKRLGKAYVLRKFEPEVNYNDELKSAYFNYGI